MNVVRFLLFIPISLGSFFLLSYVFPWLLYYLLKVLSFISFYGIQCDPDFSSGIDVIDHIEHFRSFLFTTGLGTIIAAIISGFLGGKAMPDRHKNLFLILAAAVFLVLMVKQGIIVWNSEHWFYSLVVEVLLLVIFVSYTLGLLMGFSNSTQY